MLDPAVDDYGKPIGKIWPISIQALTLKLPQLFWVAAILFLILFWYFLFKIVNRFNSQDNEIILEIYQKKKKKR